MNVPLTVSRELLAQAVDQSHDGITIADASHPDYPMIYVNAGFERLTGYAATDLIGRSVRFLQGTDTEQPDIPALREALHQGKNCLVTLRNYRKDGSMFWNELSISAIRNEAGVLTHFVGIQKDITPRIVQDQHLRQSNQDLHALNQQLFTMAHTDPVAGISNRRHFDDRFSQMLQAAQRTHSLISMLVVNLDQFKLFNAKYGRQAGDACLRMVGERIAKSFSRTSDCVARYEGDEFAVVSTGDSHEGMKLHVSKLRDQIRALNIPHSNTPDGVITICVGGVTLIPQRDTTAASLLQQAAAALQTAKKQGCDGEQLV